MYPTNTGPGGYYLIDVYEYAIQGYCYVQLAVSSVNFYWLGRCFIVGNGAVYYQNDWYSSCSTSYISNYGRLQIVITPSTTPTTFQSMLVRIIG